MIGTHRRRIDRLELGIRPQEREAAGGIDSALKRAWLATLTVDDLDFMAETAGYLEAGGDRADLEAETCKRMAAIMAMWEAFQAPGGTPMHERNERTWSRRNVSPIGRRRMVSGSAPTTSTPMSGGSPRRRRRVWKQPSG
jgi:hypothetical protein